MQEKPYSCGAACISMLFNISEKEARKLCGTTVRGTDSLGVNDFLRLSRITHHEIRINQDYRQLSWLEPLSCHFPLYLSCQFNSTSVKNRPLKRHHAVLAANGMLYDPSELRECPIDAFEHTFNKSMVIRSIILIEEELPDWRKRLAETQISTIFV